MIIDTPILISLMKQQSCERLHDMPTFGKSNKALNLSLSNSDVPDQGVA